MPVSVRICALPLGRGRPLITRTDYPRAIYLTPEPTVNGWKCPGFLLSEGIGSETAYPKELDTFGCPFPTRNPARTTRPWATGIPTWYANDFSAMGQFMDPKHHSGGQ